MGYVGLSRDKQTVGVSVVELVGREQKAVQCKRFLVLRREAIAALVAGWGNAKRSLVDSQL
jgi:hypothetical protein